MKTITWTDIKMHNPLFDGEALYGIPLCDNIVGILNDERIPADIRIWLFTRPGIVDEKTLRLFACRCVRKTPMPDGVIWDRIDPALRVCVASADLYAKGEIGESILDDAREIAKDLCSKIGLATGPEMTTCKAVQACLMRSESEAAWLAAWYSASVLAWMTHYALPAWEAQIQFALELLDSHPPE